MIDESLLIDKHTHQEREDTHQEEVVLALQVRDSTLDAAAAAVAVRQSVVADFDVVFFLD